MAVALNLSQALPDVPLESVHSLPCKFTNTSSVSSVKVDEYFQAAIHEKFKDDREVLSASLRGRPLDGIAMEVPSGYTGIVMVEPRKTFNEEDEREFHVTKQFKQFTYWNLDKQPTESDKLAQAFDWISVAKMIHSPLAETTTRTPGNQETNEKNTP